MQTNFPPAFLSGSNLGAAAKRISSLICYHAKPLVKLFIKVYLRLKHIHICLRLSFPLPYLIC